MPFTVRVFRESGKDKEGNEVSAIIAHALDYDIVAQGKTLTDALTKLGVCVETYLHFGDRLKQNPLFPAPRQYWEGLDKRMPRKGQSGLDWVRDNLSKDVPL